MERFDKELLVVSHVRHYEHKGKLYANIAYAREIDIWADLFAKVRIAAPCKNVQPSAYAGSFTRTNIDIYPIPETGGKSIISKAYQLWTLPKLVRSLFDVMRETDCIHVRCPGNIGLLGIILSPLFSSFIVAKYAGQWPNYKSEPWTYRLQKMMLRSKWWRGPVMVYGDWSNQPSHIVSSFTSVMSKSQLSHAREIASKKELSAPLDILYVGRLSVEKNVDMLLKALSILNSRGLTCYCRVVGEGPERENLEGLTIRLGLANQVQFVGGMPFRKVLNYYEKSDVLVLVSKSEGWGKAITEAMAFGLVCIGSNTEMLSRILGEGRGLLVSLGSPEALADALERIHEDPAGVREMTQLASTWAQQYSLEGLRNSIHDLLIDYWILNQDNGHYCGGTT